MKKNAANGSMGDSGAFRRQVRISALQVTGLTPDELSMALAYEVEAASGIPAAEAEISWTALVDPDPELRLYDVEVRRKKKDSPATKAQKVLKISLFVSAAVLLAVAADFSIMLLDLRAVRKEIAVRAPLDAEVRAIEHNARAKRDAAQRKRAERAAKESAQERVGSLRAAYPQLLAALAKACGGNMLVREISATGPFAVEMRAVATSAQDGAQALSALTRASHDVGWRAIPGDILTGESAMVEFSCRFQFGAVKVPLGNGR